MNPRTLWPVALAILATALSAAPAETDATGGARIAPSARLPLSLTIDPGFSRDRLPANARPWYDRLWTAIGKPVPGAAGAPSGGRPNKDEAGEMASKNDVHVYGRTLSNHIMALLHVFRLTGEMALLEEVDRLAQLMRAQLKDWSILKRGGKTYEADGYLNWVRQPRNGEIYTGTDDHVMDEMLTHVVVAEMAYAFHANRNVDGRFAERAQFWRDYLQHHFEAKWRHRMNKPTGKFLENTLTHVYIAWTRYHYYMHLLTGEEWYRTEAERRAKVFATQMIEVSEPAAFVWDHRTTGESGEKPMIPQPTTYARYTAVSAADLAYEKFSIFTPTFMTKIAAGIREFIMDNGATDFAGDIAGDVSRGGIPAAKTPHERESQRKFAAGNFTELGVWDSTGKIAKISEQVYRAVEGNMDRPTRVYIPSGMVQVLMLENGSLRK